MIGVVKKFDKALYDKCDPFKLLVLDYLNRTRGEYFIINPAKGGVDIISSDPAITINIEVELRLNWKATQGMFPFSPVHIPERKGKFVELPNSEYFAVREDGKMALYAPQERIKPYGALKESTNRLVKSGELFYNVPLSEWELIYL